MHQNFSVEFVMGLNRCKLNCTCISVARENNDKIEQPFVSKELFIIKRAVYFHREARMNMSRNPDFQFLHSATGCFYARDDNVV